MRLTFRQGILRYQTDVYATPSFLQKNGEFIGLVVSPDPTVIVFAHKAATYIVEETKSAPKAWGPFTGSNTRYLYWDINLLDGSLSRGHTGFEPIFSAYEPSNPGDDQHWYDKSNHVMKVWANGRWIEKIRVFAATYASKILPFPLGTQAGETGEFDGGNLVRDEYGKPLRQSNGTFVTTTTNLSIATTATNTVSLEGTVITGMAKENIPKFSFIQIDQDKRLKLARSDEWRSRVIGIASEDFYASEIGKVITDGLVQNDQWNWPVESTGNPIFCGVTGEISILPPEHGVSQVCGYIFDRHSIFIRIHPATILDDISAEVINLPLGPVGTAPLADFTVSETSGSAPLTVNVKSTSLHSPTSFDWYFNNENTVDSRNEEASYTFKESGTYNIKLTAKNEFGTNTKTQTITVEPAPIRGIKTNLDIQLSGPLQVTTDQEFLIQVVTNNVALMDASNIKRVITIDDANGFPVNIASMPANTNITRDGTTTVITLPSLPRLMPNQSVTTAFSIKAPNKPGLINIRAGVTSPEPDSTLSNNTTALSIRVK